MYSNSNCKKLIKKPCANCIPWRNLLSISNYYKRHAVLEVMHSLVSASHVYHTYYVRSSYIYILTNKSNSILYIGVTSNLIKRIYQHKHNHSKGFTNKYNTDKLIYYEIFEDISEAIKREKQLKNWHREWKLNLIKTKNPKFEDLYDEILK